MHDPEVPFVVPALFLFAANRTMVELDHVMRGVEPQLRMEGVR